MRTVFLMILVAGCGSGRKAGPTVDHMDQGPLPFEEFDLAQPVSTDLATTFDPDAACATATVDAQVSSRAIDIIWVVDNSGSMAPAITQVQQGLNAFAAAISAKSIDYQIVLLSLRSPTSPITVGGKQRFPVCVPTPLGGAACGNGPHFFHSSIDIKSTQPLEHLLGTLGQTAGYTDGEARGGEAWAQVLRPTAHKSFVVVSDDDSRLLPSDFEHFAGGTNPFNSDTLPPGILDASWMGAFDNYTFNGIYGWGSATNPSTMCTYANNTKPASAGPHYTSLVTASGGVRAKICDVASSWTTFLDDITKSVVQASLTCDLPIPAPPMGVLDPAAINVAVNTGTSNTTLYKVADATACGTTGGWYYDNPTAPTHITLCPTACTAAQQAITAAMGGRIVVQFGCQSLIL